MFTPEVVAMSGRHGINSIVSSWVLTILILYVITDRKL